MKEPAPEGFFKNTKLHDDINEDKVAELLQAVDETGFSRHIVDTLRVGEEIMRKHDANEVEKGLVGMCSILDDMVADSKVLPCRMVSRTRRMMVGTSKPSNVK